MLKIASSEIPHKSDKGEVILNLADEATVRVGFDELHERASSLLPGAEIQGVFVQRMAPPGQEVIVGTLQDSQFGALVMFGSGGVEVEGLADVAFGLAPLTEVDAEYLISSTWAGKKLSGYRHLTPADKHAVIDILYRLAQLASDHPVLSEIEINPLFVKAEGMEVVAVDVRMKIAI